MLLALVGKSVMRQIATSPTYPTFYKSHFAVEYAEHHHPRAFAGENAREGAPVADRQIIMLACARVLDLPLLQLASP